jgi:hypothetical protein
MNRRPYSICPGIITITLVAVASGVVLYCPALGDSDGGLPPRTANAVVASEPESNPSATAPREVTIAVVDAGARPVARATVVIRERTGEFAVQVTDEAGTVKVRLPASPGNTTIHAFKSGTGYDYFSTDQRNENDMPRFRKVPSRLKLTLGGARTVRIQAVDGGDQPIAGVTLAPSSMHPVGIPAGSDLAGCEAFQSTTGPDGVAVFDWLPTDRNVRFAFEIQSREYCTADPLYVQTDDPRAEFALRLLRRTRVAGRVTSSGGEPVAGAVVRTSGRGMRSHIGSALTKTGEDGRFEMAVDPDQAYVVVVEHNRLAANQVGVVVREGRPVTDLNLQLAEGTIIAGTVTRGPAKRPVRNSNILLTFIGGRLPAEIRALRRLDDKEPSGMSLTLEAQTDAAGRFRFIVAPGSYYLRGPTDSAHAAGRSFKVTSEQEITHDIELPEEAVLTARVVDREGRPVARAGVIAHYTGNSSSHEPLKTETDYEGQFLLKREAVPLIAQVASPGRRLAWIGRFDEKANNLHIELRPTAKARGLLLDLNGLPQPGGVIQYGVRVSLDNLGGGAFIWAFGGKAEAGPDGTFELPNLAGGAEWEVNFQRGDRGPWNPISSVEVTGTDNIDLGETRQQKPEVQRTVGEHIASLFKSEKPLPDRLDEAKKEARRESQRILLLLADPGAEVTRQLDGVLRDRSDANFARAIHDFRLIWVEAASGTEVTRVARETSLRLGRLVPPSLAIVDPNGALQGSLIVPKVDDARLDVPRLRDFLIRHSRKQD